MPKGTDVHVGFFCPQSKHTYVCAETLISRRLVPCGNGGGIPSHEKHVPLLFSAVVPSSYLVGRLRLQLLKYLQRLLLRRQSAHFECW